MKPMSNGRLAIIIFGALFVPPTIAFFILVFAKEWIVRYVNQELFTVLLLGIVAAIPFTIIYCYAQRVNLARHLRTAFFRKTHR